MKKIFCLTILAVLCTFGVASAQQFPSVQIETQDGKTIDTKTLIDGKTPVIISFWSTTCKPCIKELDAISEQMIDWLDEADFRVVAVSVDDSRSISRAKALAASRGWTTDLMVAYDKNKNGRPDEDEWYEIAGSGNFTTKTEAWYSIAVENGNDTDVFRDYEMTYYRPTREEPEESAEPDNPLAYITIKDYIRWTDNRGNNEYKVKNVYHTQTYYPAWVDENQLTFHGIRLANNAINEGKFNPGINSGSVYFVLYSFRYGYVDNSPNVDDNSAIDIDWAVDREGNPVELPGVDFIKVYNGVNQENGWLGECSTEVERGEDLHMQGKRIPTLEE